MTTSLSGLGGVGTPGIVGQEDPQWDFPASGGESRISERLRGYLMRVDAGSTGLNAAEDMPPEVIDEFRRMINAGVIRPKNQAASNIARSRGGLQAGDQTLLGPIIDGMPEGLTPEYWSIVIQKAQQAAQEQIQIMDRTGYFEGKSTLERQRIEADISNNVARTEIERRLADNTIRATDLDEAYRRDQMAQDMRQNIIAQFGYDPGPQGAMGAAVGNENASVMQADGTLPMPGSPEQQAQLQRFQASQGGQNLGGSTTLQAEGAPPAAGAAQVDAKRAALEANPQFQQLKTQIQQAQASGDTATVDRLTQQTDAIQREVEAQVGAQAPGGAPGMAGGPGTQQRPNMTTQVGSDIGWQYVQGQGWQQTLGGRQQDLAQQQQAFLQQQTQAELASNPRNYLQAQMSGQARGGLGGFAPTNQVNPSTGMPMSQPPGMGGQQWPAQPGMAPREPMMGIEPWQMGGAQQRWAGMPQPGAQPLQAGAPGQPTQQPAMPVPDGMTSISPVNPATGMRFDENTGQYTSAPMPTADENMRRRMDMFRQQGQMPGADGVQTPQTGEMMFRAMGPEQMGFQAPGNAGMGASGMPGMQPTQQPLQAGQAGMGRPAWAGQPGMGANGQMAQPGGFGANTNLDVGAFSNALNKNRLVPKSGGMGTQGAGMTQADLIRGTNPQKWRAQDFMRGNASEKDEALGTASAAGFSDADTQAALGKSLPTFKAPGAGAMR